MSAITTNIKQESKKKSESVKPSAEETTLSLDSEKPSPSLKEANVVSRMYLRDAAEHLLIWMNKMQGQEISAANVNAVCNIAQQVANLVKVNIEIKKAGL